MSELRISAPGIYSEISESDYHADPCDTPSLSSTILKLMIGRTPLHARTAHPKLNPAFQPMNKPAFDIGRAAHAVLEGGERRFVVVDADSWQTKAARDARDNAWAEGATPLLAEQHERVMVMADAMSSQLLAAGIDLKKGKAEQTLIWRDVNGVLCRCRLDWILDGLVIDFKTTAVAASPDAWGWSVAWNTGCHLQQAHYEAGIHALALAPVRFLFAVIETDPPHAMSLFEIAEESMVMAEQMRWQGLEMWRRCLETGQWPGPPPIIQRIHMPARLRESWEHRIASGDLAA